MLEFLCAIPEEIGWVMVGALGAYASVAGWMVGKCLYKAIKERFEEDEEE